MDYELLTFSSETLRSYAKLIKDIMENKLDVKIFYEVYSDYIAICHEYMTIFIDLDEIIGLDVIQEEYNFTANISIRIQMFHRTYDSGIKLLFELLRYLISRNENILLIENGDDLIFLKKDMKIYIEDKKNKIVNYPYEIFNLPIESCSDIARIY